jgi:hypothetical protein
MAVTETTTESWGSRLGGSIRGVLAGGLMFLAGFPILFWNEGNAVKTAKAIDEGEGACVSLESNAKVDAEMEGKLVHLTGKADTKDVLVDEIFGVSNTAIRLERKVEMYQWIEDSKTHEKKKLGGSVEKTTTYTYRQAWVDHAIDSSGFKEQGHNNPGAMEFESEKREAANVTFGAFRLSEKQISKIGSEKAFAFPNSFTCKVARVQVSGTTIYVPEAGTRNNEKNNRNVVSQPRIGDMRVSFSVVLPHDVSIIAKQQGDTFIDYTAKNGKKLNYLTDGIEDAAAMFATARSNNAIMTWLIRLGGFIVMFIGLGMVFKPISVLADVLPILGDIVEIGTGFVAGVISFVCAIVTIAVAWIFYRPVMGILLLVAAGALVFWLIKKRRAKAQV